MTHMRSGFFCGHVSWTELLLSGYRIDVTYPQWRRPRMPHSLLGRALHELDQATSLGHRMILVDWY